MYITKKLSKTPGSRHALLLSKFILLKNNKLIKNLKYKHKRNFGRSSMTGHITSWHKGSGCKKIYKKLNFENISTKSIIIGTMYDCNRNNIVSLHFDLTTNQFFNTTAILNTYAGSLITCHEKINELYLGYRSLVKNLPVGTLISNISINKKKASFVRAAGTYAQLIQKTNDFCKIRLPSSKIITIPQNAFATIGLNSNIEFNKIVIGKAGRNRLKGQRPTVRGIAMNPVDHPHGGRSNGGGHPKTPWGVCTKGKKTKKLK